MLYAVIAGVFISITVAWILAAMRGQKARNQNYPTYTLRFTPGVSILIPAWNERIMLERCVTSLKRSEYPDWECIIIAGGSDNTFEYAQQITASTSNFTIIPQRPWGKNTAFNDGLRVARSNIVVLLDADCQVEPGWLSSLIAPLTHFVGASLGNYSPDLITPLSMQFEMNKISTYFIRGGTTLHGGAIALHRNVIDQIGGSFPETVWVGTDWDLNARLERLGIKKVFVKEARHRTPFPSTWSQFISNEIRWRRALFFAVFRFWRPKLKETISSGMILLPYLVGILLISLSAIALLLYLLHSSISIYLTWSWIFYIAWISGRRVGQVIEVATYTRDLRLLKLFWVPPATLLVALFCCVAAIFSLWRISPHFQGYRPQPSFKNEQG